MIQTNIHEAKTNFSKLIKRVMTGEEVVIARAGEPVARLVPVKDRARKPRNPGSAAGVFRVAEDFDAPLPEDNQASFESSTTK